MKLCIDCRHYRYVPKAWWEMFNYPSVGPRQCHRPQRVSPVSGELQISDCEYQRADPYKMNECGKDGQYWEPHQ